MLGAAASELIGQVAVVTGGGRGIGRVFATKLAEAGAAVAVTGRAAEGLEAVAAEIAAAGSEALAVPFDMSDPSAAAAGFAAIERHFGRIDILINNAGIWGPIDRVWELDAAAWWQAIEINLGGSFIGCHAVLPGMVARSSGRIVNLVSHAGVHRWPTCSAYSVSKAAVIKLTENLAVELGRSGVSVFAYHPGVLPIGLSEQALAMRPTPGSAPATAAERAAEWVQGEAIAGRMVAPERAAVGLVALAAGRADALSGRYLTVHDDLEALAADGARIRREDRLTLRLRE